MKINGWTDIVCKSLDCVYNANLGECFYPGEVKLNQKCETYTPHKSLTRVGKTNYGSEIWKQK